MSNNPCNINWTNPAEILTKGPACLWQGIQSLPQTIVGGIMGALNTIWSTIDGIGRNVYNALSGIFGGIVNFIQNIGRWITNIGSGIFAGLQSLGAWIWGGLQQIGSMLLGGFQWIADRFINFINESSKWILDRLGDLRNMFEQFFKGGILGSFMSWIDSTIVSPIKSFISNIYESIKKHIVEVIIHNLPSVITTFIVGELLYRMPMMLERDQIHALEAFLMAPILVPLGAQLFNDVLKRKGIIGGQPTEYQYKTYREVKQISEAQKDTITLSQHSTLRVSVYLVKEMTELVQGIGKARIIQMQVRSPVAEYDVGLMASASIARATILHTIANVIVLLQSSASVTSSKIVVASKSITVSASGSVTTGKTVTASKTVTVYPSGSVVSAKPVTAEDTTEYSIELHSGLLVPQMRYIGGVRADASSQ